MASPREVLFGAGMAGPALPVCDHYCGVEPRMSKSLQLQAEMGPVFDVTLDNEDGAPVGAEVEQAHRIAALVAGPDNRWGRVGVRLLPWGHARFGDVAQVVLRGTAGARFKPAYLMLPKPESAADVAAAVAEIDRLGGGAIPVHALVETHGALRDVFAIAAHPRIESLSFGLMDFVSAHRGAIPQSAMGVEGQFDHPLVLRAKLEIAAACHAAAKTPSHGVVTEFKRLDALAQAAKQACRRLGYTRMWSIHPAQIKPIVEAFAPGADELEQALEIIVAAQAAQWAPIRHQDTLHDRASYRYFWELIERARRTGAALPTELQAAWFG
ncbi:MAG: CoA ester lyase [Burkholderiales bacterium]|nr:CoA ester lyase [Burkholderiales bacterium]